MKKLALLQLVSLAWLVLTSVSHAGLPDGTQAVQAESMILDGDGWTVREHDLGNWYTGQPVGRMIGGQNGQQGTATATLQIPSSGKYRIWVRYLDMVDYRSNSAFRLSGVQQGVQIIQHDFDGAEVSPRSTPEGAAKWGDGFAQWVWDFVELDAEEGELQLAVEKLHLTEVNNCTRTLDVLLLTADLDYEPAVTDLTPLYVKVKMLAEQKNPVAIHFWGRRPYAPWYTPHANINRKGIFEGIFEGSQDEPGLRMAAGQESGWVDVAPYLGYGGLNQISLYAMQSYYTPEPDSHFEVSFSTTPSDAGLIERAQRKGPGDGMIFAVDLVDYRLVTELQGSQASLDMATATPDVAGKLPSKFPFTTGMTLTPERSTAEAISREHEALRRIGITDDHSRPSSFYFHLTKTPGCLSQPDVQRIDATMQDFAEKNPDRSEWAMINLMDEPSFGFEHMQNCQDCQAGFATYLKTLEIPDPEIAKLKINNSPDGVSSEDKKSYYYTRRYMNHLMTEMLRTGTQSAQKHLPGIPTTANFACELISGNLVSGCVDWYEILESGALTYGWNEDWGGWGRSRQVNGYYVDVMRSACRKPGIDFGIYNILGHTPWEIEAHAFLEMGHGVKAINFFNYGPYYAITSDANSQRPEIYEAIKRVTFPTGVVEADVMAGATAPGDVAQLLSVTGDIWYATRDNVFGNERTWLNLLLRHCNVRCDVVSENDLGRTLSGYKMLFAADANLKRTAVPELVQWVRGGGVLYLSAGALVRDEFDAPLELDAALELRREPLDLQEDPGRSEYEMLNLKTLGEYEGIQQFCGTQSPNFQTFAAGKGKVIVVGFFPAISYIATSTRPAGAEYSALDFNVAHRDWMGKVLAEGDIQPRLRTNNYRVEANWIHSPDADLIAIANWTGQGQAIVVELDNATDYREITSATGKVLTTEKNIDGTLSIQLKVDAGDLIQLKK